MQLVEGGSAAYWTNLEPNDRYIDREAALVLDEPEARLVSDSILLWIAATWAHVDLLGEQRSEFIDVGPDGAIQFTRLISLGAVIRSRIAEWCSENARIAVVRLDDVCLLDETAVGYLIEAGIEVEILSA